MPYQTLTLNDFISQVSDLLDDPGQKYWTALEIQLATYEGLNYWGALTGYWRDRGAFSVNPYQQQFTSTPIPYPYLDMAVLLPNLRTRVYTLDQMVREIQYMLLEAANGLSGTAMSGQVTISSILKCIQDARNRFVRDTHLPISSHTALIQNPDGEGMAPFSQNTVFVHRVVWQDTVSTQRTPLYRQDSWASDRANSQWTTEPGNPVVYSESELSPLLLQLVPAPISVGAADVLTVDSLLMDLGNQNSLFNVPDEWVHAIKYAALSQILSSAGQISDPMRAQYAEQRYQQSVDFAKSATSITRVSVNGQPIPLDPISLWDVSDITWMNLRGKPYAAGILYDFLALIPGLQDNNYGVSVDVVRSAPLPTLTDFMPLGSEEIDSLKDYVSHILLFKCGGKDLTSTMPSYDSFMDAVKLRKGVNAAKIQYLSPIFQQAQKEWGMKPDRVETQNA